MSDRIAPPAETESILDDLKRLGVFATKQKAMMFAAAVGYAMRDNVPPSAPSAAGEGIRLEYFERARDAGFIDALAVADANDLRVLSEEAQGKRVALFEALANSGLKSIKRACYDSGVSPLQGILNLIDTLQAPAPQELPGLAKDVSALRVLL